MSDKSERLLFHDQLLHPRDPTLTQEIYVQWVHTYEKDLKAIDYSGPQLVTKYFFEFNLPKTSKIVDIAAGTGIVGSLLKERGYINIDGVDATPEMLAVAQQKNCYQNLITSFVSKDIRLPIEDKTYEVTIIAGCLCPGHISYESFPELIRITKRGGIICWSMALPEEYAERDPLFSDNNFENFIQKLCDQNRWQFICGFPKRVNNYSRGNDGWVYAMKIL